jgi:hypothetical protein
MGGVKNESRALNSFFKLESVVVFWLKASDQEAWLIIEPHHQQLLSTVSNDDVAETRELFRSLYNLN